MKKSTFYNILGGMWLFIATTNGINASTKINNVYDTRNELSQLEEKMQTPLSETYKKSLAAEKAVLTEKLDNSKFGVGSYLLLTALYLGLGAYYLSEARKKREEEQKEANLQ